MSLFGPSVPTRIRASLQFLIDSGRYRLIADSDAGMDGAITYRSPVLWIAAEWERSLPWLDFSPTRQYAGRFDWVLVDLLLTGAAHYDRDVTESEGADPETLAEWLRPRLSSIEDLFAEPRLPETQAVLRRYQVERARARDAHWRDLERRYAERRASRGAPIA